MSKRVEETLRSKLLQDKPKPYAVMPPRATDADSFKALRQQKTPVIPPKITSSHAPLVATMSTSKKPTPIAPYHPIISSTSSVPNDVDQVVGLCLDMCPREERLRRVSESDIHKLEMIHDGVANVPKSLRYTMIKKLQRSSADHELKIPALMRTPRYRC